MNVYKTSLTIAVTLLLAIVLFVMGWFCAKSSGGEFWKELENEIQKTARETQIQFDRQTAHFDQRLDKIEGKIDVLLKIATSVPADFKGAK